MVELKKEARDFICEKFSVIYEELENKNKDSDFINVIQNYIDLYIAGAEPREKQIQIDAEQIRALQKQNGELTDNVRELKAQIEKMKRCFNCKYCNKFVGSRCGECEGFSKWEIED